MIGVIGLGRMGGGIASTLLRNRYRIAVFDIDPGRVAALEDQVLPSAKTGTVVIDIGTTVAEETGRLHRRIKERGVNFLEAAIGGDAGFRDQFRSIAGRIARGEVYNNNRHHILRNLSTRSEGRIRNPVVRYFA